MYKRQGEGTLYGTGTVANYAVNATTNTNTTQLFVAQNIGAAANSIDTLEASTHLSFGAVTLTGGVDGGSITSTGDDIKAAIAAKAEANALVGTADKSGNDGSGIVTVMAATNLAGGSDGYVDLFELEEDFLVAGYITCSEDLTGNTATLSMGYTGQTTKLVPTTTATTLDVGESLDRSGVLAEGVSPNAKPFWFVQAGKTIRLYVGTATITDGTIVAHLTVKRITDDTDVTVSRVKAAATTNATSLKASAGSVAGWYLYNNTASAKFVKFYNKASAPTVGTDVPLFTLPLPANGGSNIKFDTVPFSTGVAYAITGAIGDTDTTAVAADDVHGFILWR